MNHFLVASVVCVDIEFYADNRLHSKASIDHHSVVVNIAIPRILFYRIIFACG